MITDGLVKGFPLKLLLIGSWISAFFKLGFILHEEEEILGGDAMMGFDSIQWEFVFLERKKIEKSSKQES